MSAAQGEDGPNPGGLYAQAQPTANDLSTEPTKSWPILLGRSPLVQGASPCGGGIHNLRPRSEGLLASER
jgi:hypothetical protein